MNTNIQPVLLGGDINCYNVARAFHEKYGVVSKVFGRYELGATKNSKIIDFTINENIDDIRELMNVLNKMILTNKNKEKKFILMGCTDQYAELIIDNIDIIPAEFITPYIDKDLKEKLIEKKSFYEICEKMGLDYPKTEIVTKGKSTYKTKFDFPVIIKPSDSVLYWKYPFDGMNKVYFVESEDEFNKVIRTIYNGKYNKSLIIQEFIPGDDSNMRVLTCYSDQNGKVVMMNMGHVLLEEHTPGGRGNHAAIITEYNNDLMIKFKRFLEDINYRGFSNFDIKYDIRDNKYKVFEINLRQGRSNYYVTSSGNNIAELVVRDRVNNESLDLEIQKNQHFWRVIPRSVVFKYSNRAYKDKIKELISQGKESDSFDYEYDLKSNFKRKLYIFLYNINQRRKFKKYYKI